MKIDKMKIISGFVVVLSLAIITSCADEFLDLEPKVNELEANAYITEQDAFEGLVAVYNTLAVQPWIHVPTQSDIVSDDAYTGGEPGGGMQQWQEQEIGVISTENAAAIDLWNKLYSGIYRANFYFTKEVDIQWADQVKRERFAAEARALRAYFYWDLVRHYGWVPLITETIEELEDAKAIGQSSPEEVFQFIVQDLLDARESLSATVADSEKGRITSDAVSVLLARVYMFYESYGRDVLGVTGELTSGTDIINRAFIQSMLEELISSGRYQLLPSYADVFDWGNENSVESIFEWQYAEKALSSDWGGWGIRGNFSSIFYGPRDPIGDPTIATGWSFGTVSWSLYNEYESGDPRREVSIYDANANLSGYTIGFQNTGYFNYKYMPQSAYVPTGGGIPEHNLPINYKDMRLAEVYLMASELFLNDNPTKAADYLNEVRVRAMGESARKATVTLDDIYHERRVELAGEGHRKWDLYRRGLDYAQTMIDASWEIPTSADNPSDFEGRQFNPDTWGLLPIPASEIRLTNEGVLEQVAPAFK